MIHKLLLSSAFACLSAGAFAVCNVAPPTVTDNVNTCATSFDIDPASGRPKFPSGDLVYTLEAVPADTKDEILWCTSEDRQTLFYVGSKIEVLENSTYVFPYPGAESYLYAVSKHTNGTEVCYSEPVKAIIKPKPTPTKPCEYGNELVNRDAISFVYEHGLTDGDIIFRPKMNYELGSLYVLDVHTYDSIIQNDVLLQDPLIYNKKSLQLTEDNGLILNQYLEVGVNQFCYLESLDGCFSDTSIFRFAMFPDYMIIYELFSNIDPQYETLILDKLGLDNIVIDKTVLEQFLGSDISNVVKDSLVVWYYKPASVLKADASWTVAGYGPNFVPQQYGTYMAEIHNTKGELVVVTKQYTVALGTPVAELASAELAISYSAGEITLSQPAHIAVYSSAGACVAQGTGTSLTLPQLPAGVYIAKASTASASAELKITIQ